MNWDWEIKSAIFPAELQCVENFMCCLEILCNGCQLCGASENCWDFM